MITTRPNVGQSSFIHGWSNYGKIHLKNTYDLDFTAQGEIKLQLEASVQWMA